MSSAAPKDIAPATNPDDFDVLDDGREVGRICRLNPATEIWWWGVSFQLTGRKSYGDAPTCDAAMAAFPAEYERWLEPTTSLTGESGGPDQGVRGWWAYRISGA